MRGWLELALVVGAGVLGWFLLQEHSDRVAAEAQQALLREAAEGSRQRAQDAEEAAEAARGEAERVTALLAERTARAEALDDSLRAALAANVVMGHEAADDLAELLADIRTHLPEPVQHLADTAQARVTVLVGSVDAATLLAERMSDDYALFRTQAEQTVLRLNADLSAAYLAADAWRENAAAEARRADNAERLMTRGLLDRIRGALPLFSMEGTVAGLIGLGVGVAVTR